MARRIAKGFAIWVTLPAPHNLTPLTSAYMSRALPQYSAQLVRSRSFCSTSALHLNRFLFDPSEIDDDSKTFDGTAITLPKNDYRTIHAAKVLGLHNGDTLRAGIVDDGIHAAGDCRFAGFITDAASIEWLPEGKIKKAQPTGNGDPPGSLRISLDFLAKNSETVHQPVSLILALPRPLQLARMLPMISQMGVDQLVLTTAKKVPKDYFGSHLFRRPEELRRLLIEGLCQCGDVRIPKVTIAKRLKPFLEDELDNLFPPDEVARVIAHPKRANQKTNNFRMRETIFPSPSSEKDNLRKRMVIAVGPEGGWDEGFELDLLAARGFQQVTMGTRVLRSDVAVVSLLSLAHDVCAAE